MFIKFLEDTKWFVLVVVHYLVNYFFKKHVASVSSKLQVIRWTVEVKGRTALERLFTQSTIYFNQANHRLSRRTHVSLLGHQDIVDFLLKKYILYSHVFLVLLKVLHGG